VKQLIWKQPVNRNDQTFYLNKLLGKIFEAHNFKNVAFRPKATPARAMTHTEILEPSHPH